ncbi:MAG: helix-turn-helix domain-containing protein [Candidatus Levyibacteriota bacterium]|nr:MAG: helix-turn-helix domain-containing protein [Candidatus Levybacteria bacterium]
MERSKLLTINQVAKILGVMPPTLRRWDKSGKLKAIRVGNKKGVGERRYRREDIIRLITKQTDSLLIEN